MSAQEKTNAITSHSYASNGFATRALHVGQEASQWTSRAVVPPIVTATTFEQFSPAVTAGYQYGRSQNPTRDSLEKALATLEKAEYAVVFGSGLAAVANITQLLKEGDHILAAEELYGGTNRYFRTVASKFGLATSYVDFNNHQAVSAAIQPNTKLVWFETPTNPLLQVIDIEAVCKLVKSANSQIIIAVDNTFLSPYFQNPLLLGVDIVMHSATKYLGGHSDVVMGMIATNRADLFEQLKYLQKAAGAVPSPFDCYLMNRSIKTLALRMEQHQKNAQAVAKFLGSHPLVRKVIYLGLDSHPQREVTKRQSSGCGGMVGMYIDGNLDTAKRFIASLRVFTLAESLGSVESLVAVPSLMSHAAMPAETRAALGIDDSFIRLSVGVENTEDLIADLTQALEKCQRLD